MRKRKSKSIASKKSDDFSKRFTSPIPRHLSPEERDKWEKDLEWEKKEHERRKREGFYPKSTDGKRVKAKMKKSSSGDRSLHDIYY